MPVTSVALPNVVTVLSSRQLPAFFGRDLLTTTGSSATSHHLGDFLGRPLKSLYHFSRFAFGRANAAG